MRRDTARMDARLVPLARLEKQAEHAHLPGSGEFLGAARKPLGIDRPPPVRAKKW